MSDSATPWAVARQAPLSTDSPGKNTGVGCRFLLYRIFLAQGSNPHLLRLLHWQVGSLPLSPQGSCNRRPEETCSVHRREENSAAKTDGALTVDERGERSNHTERSQTRTPSRRTSRLHATSRAGQSAKAEESRRVAAGGCKDRTVPGRGCPFGVTGPEPSVLNATELYSFKWLVLCVSHLNNKKEPHSHKHTRIESTLWREGGQKT